MLYIIILFATSLNAQDLLDVVNNYHAMHQNAITDTEIILFQYQSNSNKNTPQMIEQIISINNKVFDNHIETGKKIGVENLRQIDILTQQFLINITQTVSDLADDVVRDTRFFNTLDRETQLRYKFFAFGLEPYFSRQSMLEHTLLEEQSIAKLATLRQRTDS